MTEFYNIYQSADGRSAVPGNFFHSREECARYVNPILGFYLAYRLRVTLKEPRP